MIILKQQTDGGLVGGVGWVCSGNFGGEGNFRVGVCELFSSLGRFKRRAGLLEEECRLCKVLVNEWLVVDGFREKGCGRECLRRLFGGILTFLDLGGACGDRGLCYWRNFVFRLEV